MKKLGDFKINYQKFFELFLTNARFFFFRRPLLLLKNIYLGRKLKICGFFSKLLNLNFFSKSFFFSFRAFNKFFFNVYTIFFSRFFLKKFNNSFLFFYPLVNLKKKKEVRYAKFKNFRVMSLIQNTRLVASIKKIKNYKFLKSLKFRRFKERYQFFFIVKKIKNYSFLNPRIFFFYFKRITFKKKIMKMQFFR